MIQIYDGPIANVGSINLLNSCFRKYYSKSNDLTVEKRG